MEALVAAGALIQVTAALIADGPAAPVMLELAALGLVHVLASDAHSSRAGRPVESSHGVPNRLREVPPMAPYAEWAVHEGQAAILAGEDVMPPLAPRARGRLGRGPSETTHETRHRPLPRLGEGNDGCTGLVEDGDHPAWDANLRTQTTTHPSRCRT